MPRDTSPSSSRDDEDHCADPELTGSRKSNFQCPADFVSFRYKPCSSTLSSSSSTELWLIKAPACFDPTSFSGVQVPLRGLQTVNIGEHPYSILGSSGHCPELRLLTASASLGPPFSGLINICERHGNHSANRALYVVPAIPPPSLPPGLKQRFQHFQTEAACRRQAEGQPARKRKREKKIKSEPQEESERALATQTQMVIKTEVKDEPLDTGFGKQPDAMKKKKKKSKSAE